MDRKRQRSTSPMAIPMDDLKISDDTILRNATDRVKCSKCGKTVKYFCYRCFDVVGMDRSQVPTVKLPVPLDVIKHERELDGKSTAIHARVLAPNDVNLYGYNQIPTYDQPERTLLLFPGPHAKTLEEIPRDSFDRIVVLDGTWKQAERMAREVTQLQGLQRITIAPRKTLFWRFQQKDVDHLATIEAIYYTYREYADVYEGGADAYHGQYDNLMYYYRFFYNMIQEQYNNDKSKTFSHRHRKDYIQYTKTTDNDNKKPKTNDDDDQGKCDHERQQEEGNKSVDTLAATTVDI